MVLSVTNIGDNPQQPGITAEAYIPDQLIAGNLKLVTQPITLTGAAALKRGTVLGQVTEGAVTSGAKGGGNTGTGTCVVDGTTPRLANAKVGVYKLVCTVAGTNSATFRLYGPAGDVLKDYSFNGSGASFTTDDQIKVAVTDGGTDFIVGDEFDITVAAGSGSYIESVKTAVDGSAVPCAILADDADASGGDVSTGAYLMGEFNGNAIIFDSSWTLATLTSALRPLSIFIKSFVSAADPS